MHLNFGFSSLSRLLGGHKRLYILCFLPLVFLSGCVEGHYSRISVRPTIPDNFTTTNEFELKFAPGDVEKLRTETDKTLGGLGFSPFSMGTPEPAGYVAHWILCQEGLSYRDCTAEWSRETNNWFWGRSPYTVEMFVKNYSVEFIILTAQLGNMGGVKKIETALGGMMKQKLPEVGIHVTFHRLVVLEEP